MGNLIEVGMKLDQSMIQSEVEKVVQAGIISALGDPQKLIADAVNKIVNSYVDSEGKPCNRDSWRSRPYLDYLAEQTVIKATKEAINEYVESNKDEFKKVVTQQISTKKFKDGVAAAFLDAVLSNTKNSWRMPVSVNFEKQKED